ncbi:hypothetical protein G5V58_08585 [Nocardioides anomalus]|uniref:Uncharacterized protein n=1 Tax=Nocardioides anomalus TaxID=2712223 RepID=A0A6G6WC76_9ACTN|nr:hypothetical protein [Nocardioides anomalus]QIG42819.1 hypothetical protein G5V58_08585 [Nocardioides anomalus]
MESRVAASVLWLRALFAGTFAVFLGTVGHVMADGLLPAPSFLAFLYVGTVLGSLPFLARPATLPRLLVLLVGGQTVIHLCLTLTAGHRGDPRVTAPAAPPHLGGASLPTVDGHRVGSFQDAFAGTAAQPAQTPTLPIHHLVADLHAHAPMMVAHLAAAALVALWLAHGERVVFTVLVATAALVLALVRPVVPVAVPPLRRPSLPQVAAVRLRDLLLGRALSRRGPPLLAA